MNIHHTYYSPHPPINLSPQELREVIIRQFGQKSTSFQFQSFCDHNILSYLKANNLGFVIPTNTTYTQGLNKVDCARVREIIWDLIIERYLTIGSYDYDSWPYFTITERGKIYFDKCSH